MVPIHKQREHHPMSSRDERRIGRWSTYLYFVPVCRYSMTAITASNLDGMLDLGTCCRVFEPLKCFCRSTRAGPGGKEGGEGGTAGEVGVLPGLS